MPTLLRRILACLTLCGLCWVSTVWMAARPAQAAQWHLTGQSDDGLSQQYVDLDSLRGSGDLWTVDSYFTEVIESALGGPSQSVRADYITKYDCASLQAGLPHRYKDIAPDGSESEQWGDAAADPLNQATMDYVCIQMVPAQRGSG